ncbi:TlpA family protein disulfide reductase, partial [bacterium]
MPIALLLALASQVGPRPPQTSSGQPPVSAAPAYPPAVKKHLYATNDVRGKPAPKFVWGDPVAAPIPDLAGKVVLIDFWATWCGPCRRALPDLDRYAKKFAKDLVVVGVSAEPKDDLLAFLKKTKVRYPVTSEPTKAMATELGIGGIPHVLVISPDGVVRWQGF